MPAFSCLLFWEFSWCLPVGNLSLTGFMLGCPGEFSSSVFCSLDAGLRLRRYIFLVVYVTLLLLLSLTQMLFYSPMLLLRFVLA